MSDVLTKIVKQRKQSLQALQQQYPEAQVLAAAQQSVLAPAQRQPRSLTSSIRAHAPGFILECKKASPSKGIIRHAFNPVAIAKTYAPYAAAISVLTEPDFFQGSFDYLQAVSEQVQLPVLCKDFIFTPYQVALARYFGADAILLMLSVVSDEQYRSLAELARSLQLEVLTEVCNEEEMARATALGATLIGINNRDLKDLSIDLKRTQKLRAKAPQGAVVISESGIDSNRQIRELSAFADGFLVGSSLTSQADVGRACRKLIYGENKVCGLTHPHQALVAASSGALYGGFIFAQRSPRAIELTQAALIANEVPQLDYVGVFSADDFNDTDMVAAITRHQRELQLAAVQLHDLEPNSERCTHILGLLKNQLPAYCEIWFALSVRAPLTALPELKADRYVLDHSTGGTGQTFNWNFLPETERHRIFLAGGLGIDNVEQAIELGCKGLDFNSKLEHSPGQKDSSKIRQLFRKIRHYRATSEPLS
ncbi:bifunctional indole-3-glycerol-phosphate synthase TrpC/phosphoribosylanthranilate isomerase TrpF [Aliidiomarina celeris]|uniref:bifunctional indole-3-glycerol-phosphate synthase TrpC/phosphoribosylanthranilate isomerase TrpF n=1 Tax=Aliidiomarina celeris TaxID=2249428 RepID=UPI000DEAECAB|nr:bifunctional indole-3-glycerol-phosphate synthase TrpC/phosphoribosylanthranilate isomerase TrpF [Aliidiomarina celeris]